MSTHQVNNNTNNGGIGFLGLLTILFIGLKLTHYIDWSWWLVLMPMLIGFGLFVFLLVLLIIGWALSK